jgi:DNA-binding transcriptional LysR family regulator
MKWLLCSIAMQQIDITRIDLNLLVVFEALLDERHVGRAARRLCLSQSATSHALGRLRRQFGDPLFVRHHTGVEPTPRAKELAGLLADALAGIRRVVAPVEPFDPVKLVRTFTVATHDYVIAVLLTKVMALLRKEAPGVDFRCVGLTYDELGTGFDRGTVDMACGAFIGFDARRIDRLPLFDDRLVGVVRSGHPALKAGGMNLDAFVATPHVWTSGGGEARSPVDDALAAIGLSRRIAMTVPTSFAVPAIVAASDLVGVVPHRLVDGANDHGLVAFELPIAIEPMTCDLLMPTALAGTEDARWMKALLVRAADHVPASSASDQPCQ